jgi:hypothetical protein
MFKARSFFAGLCIVILVVPAGGFAADKPDGPAPPNPQKQDNASLGAIPSDGHGWVKRLTHGYRPASVPPPTTANSNRLESLLRAGNLYLSMQDTIALALENNLDIAIQRYGPQIAEAAVMQAEAGGFARGVNTTVLPGPSGATVSTSGTTPGTNQNAASTSSVATASAIGAGVLQTSGPAIPALDPTLTGTVNWAHQTTPQTSTFITGTTSLIQQQSLSGLGIQKGFLTGTLINVGLTNSTTSSNNPRNDFNPATSSSLGIGITQHLLQGFGLAVNSRQIHIARNNREVSDLTFKLQVETTVAAVMELYWRPPWQPSWNCIGNWWPSTSR